MKNKVILVLLILFLGLSLFACKSKYTYSYSNNSFGIDSNIEYKEEEELQITDSFDNIYVDWVNGNVSINISKTTETIISKDYYYHFENNTYYIRQYADNYYYKKESPKDLIINLSMITSLDKLNIKCKGNIILNGIMINYLVLDSEGKVSLENIAFSKGSITLLDNDLTINNINFDELDIASSSASVILNTDKKEPNYLVSFNSNKGSFKSNIQSIKVNNEYGFGKCNIKVNFTSKKGSFTLNAQND